MILTLEQMQYLSIDEIINLYRIGYRLEEFKSIVPLSNYSIRTLQGSIDPIVNFGKVTVTSGHNNTDTSIGINDSSRLPDPSISGNFNLIWWNSDDYPDPSDDPNREIVRCTANSSNTLTVTRGQEGISASNKNTTGKTYKMVLSMTAKTISDIQTDAQDKVDTHAALASTHGVSGAIVGTSNSQTLTNKTVTDSTNNVMAKSLKSATTTVDVSAASAPISGQVLTATASTSATWQTPTSVPTSSGTVTSETTFDQSSNAGSASTYARGDHTHGTPSSSGLVTIGTSASGQYASAKYSGSTSINWNNGNVQSLTLGNGANSLSFSNPISGGRYILLLKQPSTGSAGTITWPTISWPSGSAPTLSTANNKTDIITLVYDGSSYYGNASFNY